MALDEIVGDGDALLKSFRLRIADVFFHVGLHLPLIGGVRFAHIDGQEVRMIFIVFIDLNDVANVAAKGRSSVAAENDHQGRPLMRSRRWKLVFPSSASNVASGATSPAFKVPRCMWGRA